MSKPNHHRTDAGWIGRPIKRVEDLPLVTGQGTFTGDLPAKYYARFVRSPVASGRITKIDAPQGVKVFTGADLKSVKPIHLVLQNYEYVPVAQPVLAIDFVRFVGEPIAVVLGRTQEEAEDFADRVDVSIEPLPAVVTLADATAEGAVQVHAHVANNVVVNGKMSKGELPAEGVTRIKAKIRSSRHAALPMETRHAHASYDRVSGRTTLTCTTQSPHLFRTSIADWIGMPESELRVVAPDVGGGFGQKATMPPEFVVTTWLGRHLKTSVAWVEDRRENLIAGFHARDAELEVEGYFDKDGKLLAIDADILVNVGAYSSFPTSFAVEPLMSMTELPGVYDFQIYRARSRGIVTNTCPMAPYRGVARPMIVLVMERLMDRAAGVLNIEPTELRRRNLISSFPYISATGLTFDEATYQETLAQALKTVDLPAFRKKQKEALAKGCYLGIGVSTFSERTGFGTPTFAARKMQFVMGWEKAELSMDPSGYVEARIGASPHGQGLRTTLSQIIADEIGIEPSYIKVIHGDTDQTPYGWGTFASRSLVITGGACKLAAKKIHDKLVQIAAQMLEVAAEDVSLRDGTAFARDSNRSIPIAELSRAIYHQYPKFKETMEPGISESASYDPYGTFSNACHVALVEVDIETGAVDLQRFLVVEDAGRMINPMIVEGQIRGGVAQGIANALLEEIIYDSEGNILTATLADFLPPTSLDVPYIEIDHFETLTSASVTQAKGLGEGGAIGPPAAILNAINDALKPLNVEINTIPASPRRIYEALRECRAKT
jgi:carbon-monoxide dehydrogenase large subunit